MTPLRELEALALGIVDGEPVDWSRLPQAQAALPELAALRLIAAIATAHSAESVPFGSNPTARRAGDRSTRDDRR